MNEEMVRAFAASSDRSTRAAARAVLDARASIPRQVVRPVDPLPAERHVAECCCPACLLRQAFDR